MSSESEDFESADEGVQVDSRERRKKKSRLPSSNDEDSGQESDTADDLVRQRNDRVAAKHGPDADKQSEGWDDLEIDENKPAAAIVPIPSTSEAGPSGIPSQLSDIKTPSMNLKSSNSKADSIIRDNGSKQEASSSQANNVVPKPENKSESVAKKLPVEKLHIEEKPKQAEEEKGNEGWGNFDEDWGDESGGSGFSDATQLNKPTMLAPGKQDPQPEASSSNSSVRQGNNVNSSEPSPPNAGWGWSSWGVDSLLSSATAGITSITSHVSQTDLAKDHFSERMPSLLKAERLPVPISGALVVAFKGQEEYYGLPEIFIRQCSHLESGGTVIESSIGAPDPEDLAKIKPREDAGPSTAIGTGEKPQPTDDSDLQNRGEGFPFGNLISGVSHITKFVENTGTKVLSGGLDTLETIGKKTMEVLQDGDPGLAKKKALLGLDADKPVLSAVLREARDRADQEDRAQEQKREAKQVHYETLFDDFGGLVHLEALEMLSKQFQMQIEAKLMQLEGQKLQDLKETLQQVAELCELPESDDEEENEELMDAASLRNKLEEATQDMGVGQQLNFDPVVSNLEECMEWISTCSDSGCLPRSVFARGVSGLARGTAGALQVYHKAAELLSVKTRRSTADEADSLTQMTSVLMRCMSELATRFTQQLNATTLEGNQSQVNEYTTNIFLEAGNSSRYIQNAFQLTLPVLQVGAV